MVAKMLEQRKTLSEIAEELCCADSPLVYGLDQTLRALRCGEQMVEVRGTVMMQNDMSFISLSLEFDGRRGYVEQKEPRLSAPFIVAGHDLPKACQRIGRFLQGEGSVGLGGHRRLVFSSAVSLERYDEGKLALTSGAQSKTIKPDFSWLNDTPLFH